MAILGAHMLLYSSQAQEPRTMLREVFGLNAVDAGSGSFLHCHQQNWACTRRRGRQISGESAIRLRSCAIDIRATIAALRAKGRATRATACCVAGSAGISLSVVTDLAEVFRLGTAKEEENLAFRRYLSARHYDDKTFQILASEVQQQIDCTTCANCCRHSVVSVNEKEIEQIASYLGATPEIVALLYTLPDPDAPRSRNLLSSVEGCIFLDGNLCMVYEARPKACRNFPHVAIGTHSLGSRPSSLARWAPLCPIIFNALESYKHLTGYHPHPLFGGTSKPPDSS